jgi:hypothetical protein
MPFESEYRQGLRVRNATEEMAEGA